MPFLIIFKSDKCKKIVFIFIFLFFVIHFLYCIGKARKGGNNYDSNDIVDDDPESLSKRKGMPYVDYNNECNVELIIYTFYVII